MRSRRRGNCSSLIFLGRRYRTRRISFYRSVSRRLIGIRIRFWLGYFNRKILSRFRSRNSR